MAAKIENCLFGKAYVIRVKSGGADCGSERIQKAIDAARRLDADVVLEPGVYELTEALWLGSEASGIFISGTSDET